MKNCLLCPEALFITSVMFTFTVFYEYIVTSFYTSCYILHLIHTRTVYWFCNVPVVLSLLHYLLMFALYVVSCSPVLFYIAP